MTDLASPPPEVPVTDENQAHLLRAGDSHVIALVKQLIKEAGGVKIDRRVPGPKLAAALALAQGEFINIPKDREVDVVPKDGSRGYKFRYSTLPAIMKVVRPPLAKNGISLLQYPTVHHREGATAQYIEVSTYLTHSSGESIVGSIEIPFTERKPQQLGIVISYCRRYALNALLGIAQEDESDYDDQGIVDGPPPMANLTPASTAKKTETTKPPEKSAEPAAAAATPPPAAGAPKSPPPGMPPFSTEEFRQQMTSSKTEAELTKVAERVNAVKEYLAVEDHAALTAHFKACRNILRDGTKAK